MDKFRPALSVLFHATFTFGISPYLSAVLLEYQRNILGMETFSFV